MPATKLTPKQLFERRNTSDVFNRGVIAGLLRILNRKLVYQQIWDDTIDGIQNVTVPFFFDFGGSNISSERFIQDNYTFFTSDECTEIGLKKIDGNFDVLPQGRVGMSGVSIDSGNITNRFSMGHYTKFVDGKLQTFTSYLYSMPLNFSFNIEIRCENMITAFKIDQAIREFFYKNKTYHFNYRGTVIPVRVGFPESAMSNAAGASYVMGANPSEQWIKLNMAIQAETYQPVFDPYSEMPADVSIGSVGYGIWVNNSPDNQPKRTGPLEWKTDFRNGVFVCGQDICFEWQSMYMDRDLLQVDICYQIKGDEREYMIDSIDNHNFYHWQIPIDFTDNPQIDVLIPNTDNMSVATPPEIYVYPDPKTRVVEPENVYVKNKGFFILPDPNGTVDAYLQYEGKDGSIKEHDIVLNLDNFMISPVGGVEFECFPYEGEMNPLEVRFIIKDHYQKEIKAVSDYVSII